MTYYINKIFNFLKGFKITNETPCQECLSVNQKLIETETRLSAILDRFPWIALLFNLNSENSEYLLPLAIDSKSQLGQDLFVANRTKDQTGSKFFVEFGATDGVYHSNTWLLEKKLGWNGILAEPCKHWHNKLFQERKCFIDKRCVSAESGLEVDFLEVEGANEDKELSVVFDYANNDCHSSTREKKNKLYKVNTISLNDLLDFYGAPKKIDYLSIDTEGSEYEIIRDFNFQKYEIDIITVEHNFKTDIRNKIYKLLTKAGFKRVFCDVSRFDDWYVSKSKCAN
jgi:FkbM family methyltransferase